MVQGMKKIVVLVACVFFLSACRGSGCLSRGPEMNIKASSPKIKVGETVTVTGTVSNNSMGNAYYILYVADVGADPNAASNTPGFLQNVLINNTSKIISQDITLADIATTENSVSVVLRAERAGDITVSLGIDGETGITCMGSTAWSYETIYSKDLPITVTAP